MSLQEEKLKEIADAIRYKKESNLPIPANDFASEIMSIPTGGDDDEWQPNPTWWDIETIIKNDDSGYKKKIYIINSR